jgi:ABC-2 type transport system permease protein
MREVLALARKDIRIVVRVRAALFFTFVWPIVVAILFGTVFAKQSQTATPALRIAVVDNDDSDASRRFVAGLEASGDFTVTAATLSEAELMVRRGQRAAFVVIKPGFGEASQRMFAGQRQLEIGSDPAREAEALMTEGLLNKHVMSEIQPKLPWQPLQVSRRAIDRERSGPANGFEITFPQGIMWGIIGCVMSFTIGLVSERVRGTFVRLQSAPITRTQILAGKALACVMTLSVLEITILAIGVGWFEVTVSSYPLLALACVSASLGFVGFMMLIAGLANTEQAAGGAGWAMLMPMALFGGGMMPQFVMPSWMQTAGNASPVKWAIRGIEGAIWRDFTLLEMLLPCGALLVFGGVCFAVGVRGLRQ